MKTMKRDIALKGVMKDMPDDDYVEGTPGFRIGIMWEITRDAWAFMGNRDAEQRLQRDVANLVRRGR